MIKPYNKAEVTFDLIKEIGSQGQNSKTFVTKDHQLDAEIVAKRIEKAKLNSPADFFDESKALYASAHPNIVQIHYACQDTDHVYLAMPYYQRGAIKSLIGGGSYMTVREIVTAGCQVLSGLHNIHSKGLIHFDVKPDNILLSDRGEALLADFGLAKQTNLMGVAAQDRLYGKMMPPEGTVSDQFDLRFDIYQFGLTLYRMSIGDDAFYAQYAKYGPRSTFDRAGFKYDVANGHFPNRKAFPPHIPENLRRIIRKCLSVDIDGRYSSALEVANALAVIDGPTLDWRYSENAGIRAWEKNKSGTNVTFSVQPNGESQCLKAVSGKPRRVPEWCMALITEKQIRDFLGSYGG